MLLSACEECEEFSRADPCDFFSVFFFLFFFCMAAASKVHIYMRMDHAGIKISLNSPIRQQK